MCPKTHSMAASELLLFTRTVKAQVKGYSSGGRAVHGEGRVGR
jgi:hypothetical protein